MQVSAVKVSMLTKLLGLPDQGNAQYLYDASGKNRLHYVYEFSGCSAEDKSFRRAGDQNLPIYKQRWHEVAVYVLSSSWNIVVFNEVYQFL